MVEEELVPELHDVGKLLDNEALARQTGLPFAHHYFSDQKYKPLNLASAGLPVPTSPTWAGVRYHGGRVLGPKTQLGAPPAEVVAEAGGALADVYLTVLADHLAASTSRPVAEEEARDARKQAGSSWPADISQRHCLWRDDPTREPARGPVIATTQKLRSLLEFVAARPDAVAFYKRYGPLLDEIPEEKGFPGGVTTLKAHCDLVGRFYRVLRSAVQRAARGLTYGRDEQQTYGGMEQAWRFRLARCKVTFPQRPARAHDLGVFLRLADLMRQLKEKDHVLLHTLDTLWLFLPIEDVLSLRSVLKPLLDAGFVVEAEIAEAPLCDLSSNIFDTQKDLVRQVYVYPDMPQTIALTRKTPAICTLCQMRPSLPEPVRDEESGIAELMCGLCKSFREQSSREGRFTMLGGSWEKEDLPVAWIRVALDYDRLRQVLRELFRRYLKQKANLPDSQITAYVEQLRDTALMVDFTRDYDQLLGRFVGRLKRDLGEENIEEIAGDRPELLAIALRQEGDAFRIIDIFVEEFERLFPLCIEYSPVSLSLSISNAKYPFFEHWRYLDAPREDKVIRIQVVGRARLELSIPKFRALRNLNLEETRASSKLHRAASIGVRAHSNLLEQVELLDGIKEYPTLHQATAQGFSVAQLLAYHKIATVGGAG